MNECGDATAIGTGDARCCQTQAHITDIKPRSVHGLVCRRQDGLIQFLAITDLTAKKRIGLNLTNLHDFQVVLFGVVAHHCIDCGGSQMYYCTN